MSEATYKGPKNPLPPPDWLVRRAMWLIKRLAIDWGEFCSDSRSLTVVRQRSVFWAVLRDWVPEGMPTSSYPLLARLNKGAHTTIYCRIRDLDKAGGRELADKVRAELPKDIDKPKEAAA